MPFVIEKVVESNSQQIEGNQTDVGSPLSLILISFLLIYLFRGLLFPLIKIGFLSFIGFGFYKFIT